MGYYRVYANPFGDVVIAEHSRDDGDEDAITPETAELMGFKLLRWQTEQTEEDKKAQTITVEFEDKDGEVGSLCVAIEDIEDSVLALMSAASHARVYVGGRPS